MKRLINQQPSNAGKWLLGALPFILILLAYLVASNERLAVNPNDKLMPSFEAFGHAIHMMAFEPSKRTGEYLLWADTLASLQRLGIGVGISALISLIVGILIGIIPLLRASFAPVVTVISLVPPLAILPILFIIFGLGEVAKITLIVLGITPFLIRDVQLRVMALPEELIIKAQTLGASTWQLIVRVVLPQVLPKLIDAVRLSLGAAWLFLIAAEAISATEGLGYRIFLVRRYLAMDVILPYVLWITLLAFLTDYLLRRLSLYAFPWQQTEGGAK
ncbi:MAG: ABC transporter permease subunit [Pseudomonadota bacterium]|jgi:NitT/TauT family transport system permease protein|uniref:ABC-type nitrate/sulfonate/bicarbonate transport system, permease component n=2 Tax=Methylophaga TaxID=40222 RepID=F5SUJ5_9GAMM|nr:MULTISPECIES: ABC transporter permease subunit [Methylophaga]MEC9412140.1 ABC transporter permease subunit [Pseudomonadota bacterium]EGL55535.1 ABC-type nitrate/sulfonate/bicarbonate transport system, permease component [Methylophaga aminisulfidivorans MP]WVI86586.1 ABC transporter permease subunit [Methylophaga thalassica]GLP98865.1 ABC transporter permease [Methylophaga thalassica]HIC47147.1 ABC transporter permease subunit [Methylophaga sp.]